MKCVMVLDNITLLNIEYILFRKTERFFTDQWIRKILKKGVLEKIASGIDICSRSNPILLGFFLP